MPLKHNKLIEVALPLPEINDASAYDKMPGIGPHPKGIHHWWARLPLPAARAILFASVVDDPSAHPEKWPTDEAQNAERERLFDMIRRMMGKKLHEHPEVYAEARTEMLKHCDGKLPPVFDPFAGGGSIPLEAKRLGFSAHAGDLNPVAVLLNKCNLELAPRSEGQPPANPQDRNRIGGTQAWRGTDGLAADVRYYSAMIRERALRKIGHLYPKVRLPKDKGSGQVNVVAWIWARTVVSPNPAARGKYVPLASTFMLSTKSGGKAWVEIVLDGTAPDGWRAVVHIGDPPREKEAKAKLGTKAGKAQDFICALTETPIPRSYIQAEGKAGRLRKRLIAIVADGGRGKLYLSPVDEHETIGATDAGSEVEEARATFLAGSLPTRAEITGGVCTAYGLTSWGHLFHTRQLVALLTFSDLVREVVDDVRRDALAAGITPEQAEAYARTVTTFLALAVDRCADFNNSLCRWSSSNQKAMNLFARQALPMVFDFAEANTLGEAVGAWSTCSGYVADCVEVLSGGFVDAGDAHQHDAASENRLRNLLVSTDPPYYDNISYATLSDFFYVWLRRTLGRIHPELFDTVLTPKLPELIASPDRFGGSRQEAKKHFESGFERAFTSLRERIDTRFPITVYYAFRQNDEKADDDEPEDGNIEGNVDLTTGWETLLEALLSSGFQITSTWPVRASQKWRVVSMGANALASYIVLACRPRPATAPQTDRRSFIAELKRELPAALRHLQQGNVAPVDFAQAAIGPGMAIYSRYARILETNGKAMSVRMALSLINQTLTEGLSTIEDDFEPDTRWAIAWFEQHGFNEGDFGDAELLSKAKVTALSGLQQAGIVHSKKGKVRLLRPEELPADWDPAKDKRLTVWEMTHHLVRVYFHDKAGDEATAALLRKLGERGEVARDLAYRLFDVCEKKKRSQEAQAYNALVLGWSEIARLARENAFPAQTTLFGGLRSK
ncbi:MAG: DUF1156 domain-containing protein [Myxococcales bacterium]|jgi:putative DNA methylase|nr:DUF1156 domain-containing protein [Myxococcales bacterium]